MEKFGHNTSTDSLSYRGKMPTCTFGMWQEHYIDRKAFAYKRMFRKGHNDGKIPGSWDDMITGRNEGSSRNTYSRLSGRGLSSRSVGAKIFFFEKVPIDGMENVTTFILESIKTSSKISSITSILITGSSSSSSLSKLIGVSESFCWSFGLTGVL
ncbi:hypothetical protein Tco_0421862 [Tanacetum coccineum]